ncbi:hypothetical protein KY345_00270 [Candidatus Woesearchaeota archaeon]|nr:hypothetical protein [Candidatus Woesearchaeota archaeon]
MLNLFKKKIDKSRYELNDRDIPILKDNRPRSLEEARKFDDSYMVSLDENEHAVLIIPVRLIRCDQETLNKVHDKVLGFTEEEAKKMIEEGNPWYLGQMYYIRKSDRNEAPPQSELADDQSVSREKLTDDIWLGKFVTVDKEYIREVISGKPR